MDRTAGGPARLAATNSPRIALALLPDHSRAPCKRGPWASDILITERATFGHAGTGQFDALLGHAWPALAGRQSEATRGRRAGARLPFWLFVSRSEPPGAVSAEGVAVGVDLRDFALGPVLVNLAEQGSEASKG